MLPDKATTKTRRTRRKPIRDILIPYDCALTVHDLRSRDIEHELRKMSLQEFPNGVSVLFRVFIELSVDWYIQDQGIAVVTGGKLGERVRAAGEQAEAYQCASKTSASSCPKGIVLRAYGDAFQRLRP